MISEEIERKISDFRAMTPFTFTPRECRVNEAPQTVSTIVGARRVGKSIRALQWMEEAISQGIIPSRDHACVLDFDNPVLARIDRSELKLIATHFLKITPGLTLNTPAIFILDEIHRVGGWEDFVIELSRNPVWKVCVTGSSSKTLHTDIATALRGKSLATVLYPFGFTEFLRHRGITDVRSGTEDRATVKRMFGEYLQWGGFPALSGVVEAVREPLLREYFDTMILRDIIERHNVSKPQQCMYLLRYLISNVARPVTLNSAYVSLKNNGYMTSKDSIRDYMAWGEDAQVFFRVPIFSTSINEQSRNYHKLYCIDWALAHVNNWVANGVLTRSLENLVYLHLRRQGYRINYYLTREKRLEIDFVISDTKTSPLGFIQVCHSIGDEKTLKREIEPLRRAMAYFGIEHSLILTYDEQGQWTFPEGTILAQPVWKWLIKHE